MKLKSNFNFIAILLAAGPLGASAQGEPARDGGAAQRLVTLIDYVGGDYRMAVRDGAVIAPDEYAEQVRFAGEIRAMAGRLLGSAGGDPLARKVAEIEALVGAKADPEAVARACHEAHDLSVTRFGLSTRPASRPTLARGAALYAESCGACHGANGDGDTERARALDPHPASFKNPERLIDLSPYRVFNALTFGVPGTAMPSFESLSSEERWELAFYVFRLGHDGEPASDPFALTLADLAGRSNRELLLSFPGTEASKRLAFARLVAPYSETPTSAGIAATRERLRRALALQRSGQAAESDGAVLDAYLEGFEPVEPRLRVRDPKQTAAVEAGFRDLRNAISAGNATTEAQFVQLDAKLRRLEEEPGAATLPFVAALVIFFREGLEAALLVGALLAGLRRLGRPDAARFVHAGWLLAIPAGLLTWWISTRLIAWGADRRELMEGVLGLLASAVLFSVSFWMISKADSRRWTAYLEQGVETSLSRKKELLLLGLAFLAVYREAAETVLFTQALLLDAGRDAAQVWAGASAGSVAVFAAAYLMNRTVLKLPLGPFFAVSSLLLLVLAVSFAGSGVYELVAGGYVKPRPVAFPEVSWLGIHPDLTGLVVQLTIVGVIAAAASTTLRRSWLASAEGALRER